MSAESDELAHRIQEEISGRTRKLHIVEGGKGKPPPRLQPRSMAALAGLPVPVLQFVVPKWIPWGKLVLFCGKGGVGKTTLTCQLLASSAIGGWFLGMEIPRCKSFALLCEDDWDETHRALALIAEELRRPLDAFTDFDYVSSYGEDNTLVFCDRHGNIKTTPLYGELAKRIGDEKRDLLALDNTRHVAGVNENDNPAVTIACSLLHGLMRPTGGTTLLVGHTPKSGNSEFAGGAAWENVARSRLYLGPVAVDSNDEPVENDPRRIFRRGKSNATGTDQMNIIWDRGVFRPEYPEQATVGSAMVKEMRAREAMQVVVDGVKTLIERGINTSHSGKASNYAPKEIRKHRLGNGYSLKELEAGLVIAMSENRLLANQKVGATRCRHPLTGLGPGS